MSYDPRCYELAEVFIEPDQLLAGPEAAKQATDELAQAIQTAIEDYLEGITHQ